MASVSSLRGLWIGANHFQNCLIFRFTQSVYVPLLRATVYSTVQKCIRMTLASSI